MRVRALPLAEASPTRVGNLLALEPARAAAGQCGCPGVAPVSLTPRDWLPARLPRKFCTVLLAHPRARPLDARAHPSDRAHVPVAMVRCYTCDTHLSAEEQQLPGDPRCKMCRTDFGEFGAEAKEQQEQEYRRSLRLQAQRQRDEHQAGSERERLALQPYRPPAIDPIPDEWLQARALTLPNLQGFQEEQHPYDYSVSYGEAWAVPGSLLDASSALIAPASSDPAEMPAFAVVYKVSSQIDDLLGSDMFPMRAHRWEVRPVEVDGAMTSWAGPPTVLLAEGSEHAWPPAMKAASSNRR